MIRSSRGGWTVVGLVSFALGLALLTGCDGGATTASKSQNSKYRPMDGTGGKKAPKSDASSNEKRPTVDKQPARGKQPDVNTSKQGNKTDKGSEKTSSSVNEALPRPVNEGNEKPPQANGEKPNDPAQDAGHPFPRRAPLPELLADIKKKDLFPEGADWLNASGPLTLKDLKGKFVILDFWTYCCINCMHILPELKKLEQKYPNELVVIGVHSAKFDGEKITQNIADAILRYEIEHPVVNDPEHFVWNLIGVRSWPTVALLDPEGNLVGGRPGEFKAEEFATILDEAIPYYEKQGKLDRKPLRFDLLKERMVSSPLRFPGKVLADEAGGRLFITDSNHNRIVVTSLSGELKDIIGVGRAGKDDGDYATATFDHPQGCALLNDTLYVADTENHLLRKIDLKTKQVTTIAGLGMQGRQAWPGIEKASETGELPERWVGKPRETGINSPWALWVHGKDLYIAMAGPHQIWKMPLDESEIGPYAGNGREDIVDGRLLPREPFSLGFASFAQPSGLTSDGEFLYVADSEGSSIRAVPFDTTKDVATVVGSAELPGGRLFEFGDVDGAKDMVRLQHPLGVAFHQGKIYVADTYNHKIKAVDAKTGETKTLAGNGKKGNSDEEPSFNEPAGVSYAAGKLYIADTNNHLVRVIDLASSKVSTLNIAGLAPPKVEEPAAQPDFAGAAQQKLEKVTLQPKDGKVALNVKLNLPEGYKINPLAPAAYFVAEAGEGKVVDAAALGRQKLATPASEFRVELPVKASGETTVTISMNYYYCQDETKSGLCKVGSVVWTVPLAIAADATQQEATLSHTAVE